MLTVIVLFALIGPWLMRLALTLAGSTPWAQMPTNTFAWQVICAIVPCRSAGVSWPMVEVSGLEARAAGDLAGRFEAAGVHRELLSHARVSGA